MNLDTDGDVLGLPNEADNVMSVGATGPIGYRWDDKGNGRFVRNYHAAFNKLDADTTTPAPYSNYGSEAIDISARGGNYDQSAQGSEKNWQYDLVLSTVFEWADDGSVKPAYGWKAGTSMAAPQVTAAVALVKSRNPDATPAEIRAHLEATARDLGDPEFHGEGNLDLEAAVRESL